ncbi:MAG: hypothetical protein CR986_10080 [Ignavibacteriae bacterium]|nr:MAG: hypothetical protein CR986_10080 [Ignavibacteriota bacterium]
MQHYSSLVSIHILFAGMWVIFFAADILIKKQVREARREQVKNKFISLYLKFTNLFGIVGSVGITITGIIIVFLNPGYGFFDMSHAHWLATKQIIFVIILLTTFFVIIPQSKKLRLMIAQGDAENIHYQFEKIAKVNRIINVLVILNLAFALTHRMYT